MGKGFENEKYIKSKVKSCECKSVQMFMVKYQKRVLVNANIK